MTEEGVLLFVDAIEDDEVRVLLGEQRHVLPRALLPPGRGRDRGCASPSLRRRR